MKATPLRTGDVVAHRYEVLDAVGAGGVSHVYRVRHLTDQRLLALKVLDFERATTCEPWRTHTFERLARLTHPNVVAVHDAGVTAKGRPFLAMDLVQGADLSSHKHRYGDVGWMLPVLAQVADGLAALHGAGLIHRDLKPRNVMLTPAEADAPTAKLVDIGVAPPTSRPDAVAGTPVFLAPELYDEPDRAHPTLDLFAYGVLAHTVLTRRLPFAEPPLFIWARDRRLPELLPLSLRCPELTEGVSEVLMRCLDPEPAKRPPATEIAAALHGA